MTAMSGAERQRRYRASRDASHDILLKILAEVRSLRDIVTKLASSRNDSRAREYMTLTTSESYLDSSLVQKPPQRRGTRLPADFMVPQEWKDEGTNIRERDGLPPINLDAEARHFVDFWHAKAGRDGCKLDWRATWRNWCRNARGSKPTAQPPATNGHSPQINEFRAKQLAELARKGIHVLPGSMT